MKKQKTQVKVRGAPPKKETEKIMPNGLRPDQWKYLQQEARARGLNASQLLRQAIDWFIEALDTGKQIPTINKKLEEDETQEDHELLEIFHK